MPHLKLKSDKILIKLEKRLILKTNSEEWSNRWLKTCET